LSKRIALYAFSLVAASLLFEKVRNGHRLELNRTVPQDCGLQITTGWAPSHEGANQRCGTRKSRCPPASFNAT
jgi:hypothetical protein